MKSRFGCAVCVTGAVFWLLESNERDVCRITQVWKVFCNIKKERIYRREYVTIEEVKPDMFRYIEVFYNRKCLHSVLGLFAAFYRNGGRTWLRCCMRYMLLMVAEWKNH